MLSKSYLAVESPGKDENLILLEKFWKMEEQSLNIPESYSIEDEVKGFAQKLQDWSDEMDDGWTEGLT